MWRNKLPQSTPLITNVNKTSPTKKYKESIVRSPSQVVYHS